MLQGEGFRGNRAASGCKFSHWPSGKRSADLTLLLVKSGVQAVDAAVVVDHVLIAVAVEEGEVVVEVVGVNIVMVGNGVVDLAQAVVDEDLG